MRDSIPRDTHSREVLEIIQNKLFSIGAQLASDPQKKMSVPEILESDVELLEKEMDAMDEQLPALKNFILPGGHVAVSHCHVARCICRRAERISVALSHSEPVADLVIRYLNRLSDYLFMLSRKIGQDLGAEEVIWKS